MTQSPLALTTRNCHHYRQRQGTGIAESGKALCGKRLFVGFSREFSFTDVAYLVIFFAAPSIPQAFFFVCL